MTPLSKLYKYLHKRASTPMLRCPDEELELTPGKLIVPWESVSRKMRPVANGLGSLSEIAVT